MKNIIIKKYKDYEYVDQNKIKNKKIIFSFFNSFYMSILLFISIFIILLYLILEDKKNKMIIKELIKFKNSFKNIENISNYPGIALSSLNKNFSNIDKEMIGLKYPEIDFDKIKINLNVSNIINSFVNLMNQLEIKLIYLEKEINVTKLVSFYTARKIKLDKNNATYDEYNLTELYQIINWIVIHKSNQLKGIASDKYLACKYAKLKLGKNLCGQRIAVFNNFEEINFKTIRKFGDVVLKISNSCGDKIFIDKNISKKKFINIMQKFKKSYEGEHGLKESQFYHLYAKKRIIVEKTFTPRSDLYEFKIFIVNNNIKIYYLRAIINEKLYTFFYDPNFKMLLKSEMPSPLNDTATFNTDILKEMTNCALKLSEDFPNFIRVDLYLYHNKIYLSELTFASHTGLPFHRKDKFIIDSVKNFQRFDDVY
jgi:hypothetical protein